MSGVNTVHSYQSIYNIFLFYIRHSSGSKHLLVCSLKETNLHASIDSIHHLLEIITGGGASCLWYD